MGAVSIYAWGEFGHNWHVRDRLEGARGNPKSKMGNWSGSDSGREGGLSRGGEHRSGDSLLVGKLVRSWGGQVIVGRSLPRKGGSMALPLDLLKGSMVSGLRHGQSLQLSLERKPLDALVMLGLDDGLGGSSSSPGLEPFVDLVSCHVQNQPDLLLHLRGGVLRAVLVHPLEPADLKNRMDDTALVVPSHLAVPQPAADLKTRQTGGTHHELDLLLIFLRRGAIPGLVELLESGALLSGKPTGHDDLSAATKWQVKKLVVRVDRGCGSRNLLGGFGCCLRSCFFFFLHQTEKQGRA